ncbi:MAG: nuclease-related domain-containing protein [Pseudomonadota bacterium]
MNDFLTNIEQAFVSPSLSAWPVYAALVVVLLLVVFVARWLMTRNRQGDLQKVFDAIASDRLSGVVIPKADDGEIHIETILLTSKGIVVIDVRNVNGIVFGSDKMKDWTVMDDGRRYTMANPQESLLDRIAAVRLAAPGVPVDGRVVFSAGAEFSKGRPSLVCTEAELRELFAKDASGQGGALFDAGWDSLKDAALFHTPQS